MTKNTLVTGGAGFIGSHLVDRLLTEGHNVTVLDNVSTGRRANLEHQLENNRLKFVEADIRDFEKILPHFKNIDIVFHMAALADIVPSIVNPQGYYTSNVLGTMHVCEASRLNGVKRLMYTASSSCYGIPPEGFYPTTETAPIDPRYPYALTKYLGEQTALHWGKVYKLPTVSLRLFNVYGPRSRTSGTYGAVFGVFLAQKLAGKPFTVVGDGTQTRDFTFVTDIADAFVTAAFSDVQDEVFNVGTGNPQSVNKLISLLGGEKTFIPKRPGEPDCTWADISKIKSKLKWQPKISFEQGVAEIIKHIDYWREAPVWTPETIEKATADWFKYLGRIKIIPPHPEAQRAEGSPAFVYILTNKNHNVLYAGSCRNLIRRLNQHRKQYNHGFTKKYNVNKLIHYEMYHNIREASSREREIKGWKRQKKIELIKSRNPEWKDLSWNLQGDPSLTTFVQD